MAKPTIALIYDFDKTLSTTDMQEYEFIKNLGLTPEEFWGKTAKLTAEHEMDKILAYMYMMVKECKDKEIPLTEEYLKKCGESVVLYRGVTTWFDRINNFAQELGCNVEHYIVSSGITEIIEGTQIAKFFKKIYGCNFLYDANGIAIWPSMAVNFTQKTQFIFRIAKGVLDVRDDNNLNRHNQGKRIDLSNMIYIGDGLTDIPCMTVIREAGGKAIALYPRGGKEKVVELVNDNRINYVCVADYSENSTLEKIVKLMIESMNSIEQLKAKEEKQLNYFIKSSESVE